MTRNVKNPCSTNTLKMALRFNLWNLHHYSFPCQVQGILKILFVGNLEKVFCSLIFLCEQWENIKNIKLDKKGWKKYPVWKLKGAYTHCPKLTGAAAPVALSRALEWAHLGYTAVMNTNWFHVSRTMCFALGKKG